MGGGAIQVMLSEVTCYFAPGADTKKRGGLREGYGQERRCPQCGSAWYKRNGHLHTGKQNHRCKVCGRAFVLTPENHVITEEQRMLIERLDFVAQFPDVIPTVTIKPVHTILCLSLSDPQLA
jgi:hypothetical protein